LPGADFGGNVARVEFALGLDTNIRVVGISFKASCIDDILIGIWGVSSVAATISGVAVNNLLH